MTDREKVIKGLECCIQRHPDDVLRCTECPYKDPTGYCLNVMKTDALSMMYEMRKQREADRDG